KHLAGELTIGDNSGQRCSNHPNQKVKCETESAPGTLETISDEPQKPQCNSDHQRVSHSRHKNVGDEAPDFPRADPSDIEDEIRIEILVQDDKHENKCV